MFSTLHTSLTLLRNRSAVLLRSKGPLGLAAYCLRAAWHLPTRLRRLHREAVFDREMGVETSPLVAASDLGIDAARLDGIGTNARGTAYMPTPAWALPAILAGLPIHFPDCTFIDLGSGMGRVVLLAAQYPFRKVVGVEFSAELHRIAEKNLSQAAHRRRAGAVELICRDAREYVFPPGNLAIYMFNPFQAPVMQTVLDHLERRAQSDPGELSILYYNPVLAPLLDSAPFLERTASTRLYSVFRGRKPALPQAVASDSSVDV